MTYTLVYKRYAPFKTFGGGFHGDGRTSASLTGSARTWGFVTFDFSGVSQSTAVSSPTWHKFAPGTQRTGTPAITTTNVKTSGSADISFTTHTAGAIPLPLVPAPPIDTFVEFRMTQTAIQGNVFGDAFPSLEIFLIKGVTANEMASSPVCPVHWQELCHWSTPYGAQEGPATKLWGTHRKQKIASFACGLQI